MHFSREILIGRALQVEYSAVGTRYAVSWAPVGVTPIYVWPGWSAGDIFELRQLVVRRTAGSLVTTMQPEVWTVATGGESSTDRVYQYGIGTPTPQTDTRFPPDTVNSGALPVEGGRIFQMVDGRLWATPNAVLAGAGEVYNLIVAVARIRRV